MTRPVLLITGNDRLSAIARKRIGVRSGVIVATDSSTNWRRVLRLLRRRTLSLPVLVKMFVCELRRPRLADTIGGFQVSHNRDILSLLASHSPERVYLFRAGLIVTREVLAAGVPILNVHCARVPEYGGLGSIAKALQDGAYDQAASLHCVTESIDRGEVLDTEQYRLDPDLGYCANENLAYEAGIRLLLRHVGG